MIIFVGRSLGFHPDDPFVALRAEEVMAARLDIHARVQGSAYQWEIDKDKFFADRKVFAEQTLPKWFEMISNAISRAEAAGAMLCPGRTLTTADLVIASMVRYFKTGIVAGVPADICDAHPKIMEVCAAVTSHPKVKEWRAKQGWPAAP